MTPINRRGCPLQQLLSGSIHQSDAAFHVSGDKAAADGVDYVLMQRLQAEQLAAFVAQLHARLPELGRQSAGEMRHREISEEVYQDDDLKRLQVAARGNLKRGNTLEEAKLQQRAEADERHSRRHISPVAGQQNAGNNNDQRIEEVEKGVNAAGNVNQGGSKSQVGENLNDRLTLVLLPNGCQEHEQEGNREPGDNHAFKEANLDVIRSESDDQEFNGEKARYGQDTDFHKPRQPCPLVESNVSHPRLSLCRFRKLRPA